MSATVATKFTAIDKFSAVIDQMKMKTMSFGAKAELAVHSADRAFRKLTPALSGAMKEFLHFASAAAISSAIVGGVAFSTSALMDYEKQVASFRTIVSDATDKEFAAYKTEIGSIATETKASSIEVAASFEKIAGLNSKFAETADGLGLVSKASIVLSKASGDELGASAENLVGIMNQFSLGAEQADRAINVLAAGQAVGASTITQSAEAYKNFGAVAAGANITLEESQALIQTLASKQMLGAEAGTKLRGAVLQLQKAGMGYASGQFNINDALEESRKKFDKLRTAEQKDAAVLKMFGAENITAGKILMENIGMYEDFTKGVTGSSEAQKAAEINSSTLTSALDELKNQWINLVTGSGQASAGLDLFKKAVVFLTDNMGTIVTVGAWVIGTVLAIKAAIFGAQVVMQAITIFTKAYTAAQWLLNAAMTANPIGLIIVAIAALIALVVVIIAKWNEWGAALSLLLGPLGIIISMIQSFRANWDMITEAFKNGGILAGLKAIGVTILDAILMPLQQLLEIAAKVTGMDWAKSAASSIEKFRTDMGVNVTGDEATKEPAVAPPVNAAAERHDQLMEKVSTNNARVAIDVNDPTNRTKVRSDSEYVSVNTPKSFAMQ